MFPLMARTVDGDQPFSAPSSSPGLFRLLIISISKKKALGTNLTIRMQTKALNYFTFTYHANKRQETDFPQLFGEVIGE